LGLGEKGGGKEKGENLPFKFLHFHRREREGEGGGEGHDSKKEKKKGEKKKRDERTNLPSFPHLSLPTRFNLRKGGKGGYFNYYGGKKEGEGKITFFDLFPSRGKGEKRGRGGVSNSKKKKEKKKRGENSFPTSLATRFTSARKGGGGKGILSLRGEGGGKVAGVDIFLHGSMEKRKGPEGKEGGKVLKGKMAWLPGEKKGKKGKRREGRSLSTSTGHHRVGGGKKKNGLRDGGREGKKERKRRGVWAKLLLFTSPFLSCYRTGKGRE